MFVIRMAAFTVPMLRFPTRWPRASRAATEWSQCRIRLGCRTWAATQADRKDPRLEPPTQYPRHQYCGPTDDQTQQCTFAECAMARPASRWPLMGPSASAATGRRWHARPTSSQTVDLTRGACANCGKSEMTHPAFAVSNSDDQRGGAILRSSTLSPTRRRP